MKILHIAIYTPDAECGSKECGPISAEHIERAWLYGNTEHTLHPECSLFFYFAKRTPAVSEKDVVLQYLDKQHKRLVSARSITPVVQVIRLFRSGVLAQTKAFIKKAREKNTTDLLLVSEKKHQWILKILWRLYAKEMNPSFI